jgi:hypothetical protein
VTTHLDDITLDEVRQKCSCDRDTVIAALARWLAKVIPMLAWHERGYQYSNPGSTIDLPRIPQTIMLQAFAQDGPTPLRTGDVIVEFTE